MISPPPLERTIGPLRRLVGPALLVIASAMPAVSGAQVTADTTMFAVSATQTLYTVQRATGATATVTTGLPYNTSAIARDPVTGRIFLTSTNYGAPATQNGRVAYYDPATGANVVVNGTGNGDNVVRLAFNTSGQLFGIGSNSPTTLYEISTATGVMTALGTVKVGSTAGADLGASGDLAFDYDGTLYANATSPAGGSTTLYRIATTASAGVFVATTIGTVTNSIEASLAFGADGQLYAAGSNNTMYAISKSTGGVISTVTSAGIAYFDFATSPRFADLSVTGTASALPIGDTATYTISVANGGPQSANGQITVVDSLPSRLTYAGVTGSGWTCSAVGRRVTCVTPGPLAVGATTTFTLSVTVAAGTAVGTSLPNVVRVVGSTIDPDQSDNRISIPGTAVANIDFTLAKSHAGIFVVGGNGTYTLTVKNVGTTASSGTITMLDTLPTGMSYVSGVGTSWTCARTSTGPDVVSCTRTVAVAAGATVTIALTVAVAQAAAPSQTNTARLTGGNQIGSEIANDPTTIDYRAVDVTPDASPVSQLPSNGTSYTATYTVRNTGSLSDTYTLATTKAPGTTVSITSVNGVAGSSTSIVLAAGATLAVPVVYTVATAALAGAIDTLKLSATSTASVAVTNAGSWVVTVVRAGLAITKQLYRADGTTPITVTDQVSPGEIVQFLVSVAATGEAGSTLVHVTDPLPSAVTFISTTGDAAGWTITQSGGMITADLAGTLAVSATRFFWIKVKVI
jgi:uncharacterized repeat protein (TIGR01451 family)